LFDVHLIHVCLAAGIFLVEIVEVVIRAGVYAGTLARGTGTAAGGEGRLEFCDSRCAGADKGVERLLTRVGRSHEGRGGA
jgi:hypothetical protein